MLSERAPESFNFSLGRRVPGAAMYQVNVELGAQKAQVVSSKAGVIVQEQSARNPSAGNRVVQHHDKAVVGFSETGFQIRDDPAAIIQKSKNNGSLTSSRSRVDEHGPMQGIGLPQLPAHRGLPAKARRNIQLHARAGQAVTAQ